MGDAVRFAKLEIGSADNGAIWFVADELTHQIVRTFFSEGEAKAWLATHGASARRMLQEHIDFYDRVGASRQ